MSQRERDPGSGCRRFPAHCVCALLPAWVILWIDVVELQRRLPMYLHDRFSASHREVVHVGIEERKASGGERFHLVRFKLVAHSEFERPGNHRYVFPVRVPVWRDSESIRHLQPNREIPGCRCRVALQHRELCTRPHHWRRRPPGNRIRRECVDLVRVLARCACEQHSPSRQQSSHCHCKGQITFHV
jgi:hypothetical protein